MKSKKKSSIVLTIIVLSFITLYALLNIQLIKEPVNSWLKRKDITFSEFTEDVEKNYISDDLFLKNSFINLNGLFAKLSGRRVHNDVILMNNGMLTGAQKAIDMTDNANTLQRVSQYLSEEKQIPFLYVQAPYKNALEDNMLPEGVVCYANKNADDFLKLLEEREVATLDLRPYVSRTSDMVKEYFYDTDTHWNFKGAFIGFQKIMEYIQLQFVDTDMDLSYADIEQWECCETEIDNLGYYGRRVGIYYGGLDDVSYYIPRFETSIGYANFRDRVFRNGSFSDAILREDKLKQGDYYNKDTYQVYAGGNPPIESSYNINAPIDKRILIIKDSFVKPIFAYMSTLFSRVDLIDMRYLTECSALEYVEATNPDMVIMMINPTLFSTDKFFDNWGIEKIEELQNTPNTYIFCISEEDIIVESLKNGKDDFTEIDVESGAKYILDMDDIILDRDYSEGVVVSLYNKAKKEYVASVVYDVEYCREKGNFEWKFNVPNNKEQDFSLIFFAGARNFDEETKVIYQNVILKKEDIK